MGYKNPALGVALAVCGCCCTALGYTLQKLAHKRSDAEKKKKSEEVHMPTPFSKRSEVNTAHNYNNRTPQRNKRSTIAPESSDFIETSVHSRNIADVGSSLEMHRLSHEERIEDSTKTSSSVVRDSDVEAVALKRNDNVDELDEKRLLLPSRTTIITSGTDISSEGATAAGGMNTGMLSFSASTNELSLPVSSSSTAASLSSSTSSSSSSSVPYWRYWQFLLGVVFLIIGAIISVFVFSLAGQSELAPMGAVTLITNQVFARLVLKEEIKSLDWFASLLMTFGTTLSILFSEKSSREYKLDDILELVTRPAAITGSVFALLFMASAGGYVFLLHKRKPDIALFTPVELMLDCSLRALIGGCVGGYTGFTTKSFVEVVSQAIVNGNSAELLRPEPYGFLFAVVVCLYLQLNYLNSGLARHDTARIVPVYQSCLIFSSIYSGWLYFDEVSAQTTTSLTLFGVGICITTVGMLVLMQGEAKKASSSLLGGGGHVRIDTTSPSASPSTYPPSPTSSSPSQSPTASPLIEKMGNSSTISSSSTSLPHFVDAKMSYSTSSNSISISSRTILQDIAELIRQKRQAYLRLDTIMTPSNTSSSSSSASSSSSVTAAANHRPSFLHQDGLRGGFGVVQRGGSSTPTRLRSIGSSSSSSTSSSSLQPPPSTPIVPFSSSSSNSITSSLTSPVQRLLNTMLPSSSSSSHSNTAATTTSSTTVTTTVGGASGLPTVASSSHGSTSAFAYSSLHSSNSYTSPTSSSSASVAVAPEGEGSSSHAEIHKL